MWQIVGELNGIDKWSASIVASRLEGGQGRGAVGSVGSVRVLTRDDGGTISERLLVDDEIDRCFSYEFASGLVTSRDGAPPAVEISHLH